MLNNYRSCSKIKPNNNYSTAILFLIHYVCVCVNWFCKKKGICNVHLGVNIWWPPVCLLVLNLSSSVISAWPVNKRPGVEGGCCHDRQSTWSCRFSFRPQVQGCEDSVRVKEGPDHDRLADIWGPDHDSLAVIGYLSCKPNRYRVLICWTKVSFVAEIKKDIRVFWNPAIWSESGLEDFFIYKFLSYSF